MKNMKSKRKNEDKNNNFKNIFKLSILNRILVFILLCSFVFALLQFSFGMFGLSSDLIETYKSDLYKTFIYSSSFDDKIPVDGGYIYNYQQDDFNWEPINYTVDDKGIPVDKKAYYYACQKQNEIQIKKIMEDEYKKPIKEISHSEIEESLKKYISKAENLNIYFKSSNLFENQNELYNVLNKNSGVSTIAFLIIFLLIYFTVSQCKCYMRNPLLWICDFNHYLEDKIHIISNYEDIKKELIEQNLFYSAISIFLIMPLYVINLLKIIIEKIYNFIIEFTIEINFIPWIICSFIMIGIALIIFGIHKKYDIKNIK